MISMAEPIFYPPTTLAGMLAEASTFQVARELAPAGLRSSPKTMRRGASVKPHSLIYDSCAAEREQAPSPRGIGSNHRIRAPRPISFAFDSAAQPGRRFVLCLPLETL
ncbi:conserved hypothetical protein [Pseudomonas sp. IT-P100]